MILITRLGLFSFWLYSANDLECLYFVFVMLVNLFLGFSVVFWVVVFCFLLISQLYLCLVQWNPPLQRIKAPVRKHICVSSGWLLLETLQGFLSSMSSSRQIGERLRLQSQGGFFFFFLCARVYERVCLLNRRSCLPATPLGRSGLCFHPLKSLLCSCQVCSFSIPETLFMVYGDFKPLVQLRHEQTGPPPHSPDILELHHIAGITYSFSPVRKKSRILFTPWDFVLLVCQVLASSDLWIKNYTRNTTGSWT